MARKMKIPKAAQIRGIKKALRNRRTPKGFLPGLRKRLRKLGGALVFLLAACFLHAAAASAQTPVIIQPTQQTLASSVNCTGSAQTFPVKNRNQTQHFATASASAGVTSFSMIIQGVDLSGNVFQISDVGQVGGSVSASGYFPTVQLRVVCLPTSATFTVSYSASSATSPVNAGSFLTSQIDKLMYENTDSTLSHTTAVFTTPFGSSSGRLLFINPNTPGTAELDVECEPLFGTGAFINDFSFSTANTASIQQFYVPADQCPQMQVSYSGASMTAGNFNLEYIFDPPGLAPSLTQTNGCVQTSGSGLLNLANTVAISVGANTTQRLVAPRGVYRIVVCSLTVSVGVAGTIQLTEGTGATCGSSTTNVSGAMTLAVGTPVSSVSGLPIFATNVPGDGLCITTAGGATAGGLLSFQYLPI